MWRLFILVVFLSTLYAGYSTMDFAPGGFADITAELMGVGVMSRDEEIVKEFFDSEFANRAIPHLRDSNRESFDRVVAPRPHINNIIVSEGNPERVETIDLSKYGIRRQGTVHWYGRLGLITLVGRSEIYWVTIAPRERLW